VIEHPPLFWTPLSQLPTVTALIDGLWEAAEQQRVLLEEVRRQPYVLTTDTVEGVVEVVTALHGRVRMVADQLQRWEEQDPTDTERREIARAAARLERLQQVGSAILALADDQRDAAHSKRHSPTPRLEPEQQ